MFSCVACGGVRVVVDTPIYNDACLAVCVASSVLLDLYCELVCFECSRVRVTHTRARSCPPLVI